MKHILVLCLAGCMFASSLAAPAAAEEGNGLVPYAYVLSEELPQIDISTEDGLAIDDLSLINSEEFKGMGGVLPTYNYVNAEVSVSNCEGWELEGVSAQVKVRGNYSSVYPKRPIRIKFEEKQAMCGVNGGAEFKSWVLLADYRDTSLLRNPLAFTLAKSLYSARPDLYSADFRPVEVNLNGEYQGVYLLTEQQEVKEHRVDLPEPEEDEVGIGYFFEYDGYYVLEKELERFAILYDELQHEDGTSFHPFEAEDAMAEMEAHAQAVSDFAHMVRERFPYGFIDGTPVGAPVGEGAPGAGGPPEGMGAPAGAGAPAEGAPAEGAPAEGAPAEGASMGGAPEGMGAPAGEGGPAGGAPMGGTGFDARSLMGSAGFTIKSDVNSEAQRAFVARCVQTIWKVIYDAAYGEHEDLAAAPYHTMDAEGEYIEDPSIQTAEEAVSKVVDIDSLVDMYILQELAEDNDLDWSSFLFTLDMSDEGNHLLTYNAPWDFDSAFGNDVSNLENDALYGMNTDQPWLVVFDRQDWFWQRVYARYQEAVDAGVFANAAQLIDDYTAQYAEAYERNNEKWKVAEADSKSWDAGNFVYDTQTEAAAVLKDWYLQRVENLGKLFAEKAQQN